MMRLYTFLVALVLMGAVGTDMLCNVGMGGGRPTRSGGTRTGRGSGGRRFGRGSGHGHHYHRGDSYYGDGFGGDGWSTPLAGALGFTTGALLGSAASSRGDEPVVVQQAAAPAPTVSADQSEEIAQLQQEIKRLTKSVRALTTQTQQLAAAEPIPMSGEPGRKGSEPIPMSGEPGRRDSEPIPVSGEQGRSIAGPGVQPKSVSGAPG